MTTGTRSRPSAPARAGRSAPARSVRGVPDPSGPPDPTRSLGDSALAWDVVRAGARAPRGAWARVDVVERTGSTNADLAAAAALGPGTTPDRTVLVAHHQDAGRGRRDRVWEARPAEGLTMSVLLRPDAVPGARWGWAPLLAGVALVLALEDGGVPVALKWPNDLLLGDPPRKAGGILAEVVDGGPGAGPALVIGIGVNVLTAREALPDGATSLAAEGAGCSRADVLGDLLASLGSLEADWRAAGGDAGAAGLLAAYRSLCATLGRRVRVALPGGGDLVGEALDVDDDGRLVVRPDGAGRDDRVRVSAGDVVHVRTSG